VELDIRDVCESIMMLLRNDDEEMEVDLMVVVAPDAPQSLFLVEGLRIAWEKLHFRPVIATSFSDLPEGNFEFVWDGMHALTAHPVLLERLLQQDKWTVLEFPRIKSAPNFVI